MEGVGSRLGRSSTRYGAGPSPVVFSGPVRKWKKKWVHITPPPISSSSSSSKNNNKPNSKPNIINNNNNNKLSLFKWIKTNTADEEHEPDQLPPPRKFRYIPIAKLEEQKNEAEENDSAEIFGNHFKPSETKAKSKRAVSEEKPDINDMPMYENQGRGGKVARHDLNEGTFDLSLG